MAASADRLVTGYIRQIEDRLSERVIPEEIYQLCLSYYPSSWRFVLLHYFLHLEIHATNATNSGDNANYWKWSSTGIGGSKAWYALSSQFTRSIYRWSHPFGSVCCASNVTSHQLGALFSSAGAGILLSSESPRYQRYVGNVFQLPPLIKRGNYLTYHKNHGLISVGGNHEEIDKAFVLPLNHLESMDPGQLFDTHQSAMRTHEFEWKYLSRLNKGRRFPSAVVIDEYDGNEKLFVVGGCMAKHWDRVTGSVEMMQLSSGSTEHCGSICVPREQCGICYDFTRKQVWICGGSQSSTKYWKDASRSLERFDVVKMKAYHKYPATLYEHPRYPLVWNDENNPDILNVASVSLGTHIEFIDLRARNINQRWQIKEKTQFGTDLFSEARATLENTTLPFQLYRC